MATTGIIDATRPAKRVDPEAQFVELLAEEEDAPPAQFTYLDYDAGSFDLQYWLAHEAGYPALPLASDEYPAETRLADLQTLLSQPEGRRALTALDPLLFCIVYFINNITSKTRGTVTFSDFHLASYREAATWVRPVRALLGPRRCKVAARGSGKSLMFFKMLVMWGAVNGYLRFVVGLSDTIPQVSRQFNWWRRQMIKNPVLRMDYREFCARPPGRGANSFSTNTGFTFVALGIDQGLRGLNDDDADRPDMILLDDIEPKDTTPNQMQERLDNILGSVLRLGSQARVIILGTTTAYGGIIHDTLKGIFDGPANAPTWVTGSRIKTDYFPPIVVGADGRERSCWPGEWPLIEEDDNGEEVGLLWQRDNDPKWPMEMENRPILADSEWWQAKHFVWVEHDSFEAAQQLLFIDPATTDKASSDQTGFAVVSVSADRAQICVHAAFGKRLIGQQLSDFVYQLVAEEYPEVVGVFVESDQGGDHWYKILDADMLPVDLMACKITQLAPGLSKVKRLGRLLNHYVRGRVVHELDRHGGKSGTYQLEQQAMGFKPEKTLDDILDAVSTAAVWFFDQEFSHEPPPLVGEDLS